MTDTMETEQTEQEQAEAEQAEANTEAEDSEARAKTMYAGRDFDIEVLDDLPDNAEAGRSRLYFEILEAIAGDAENLGKWHTVAKFGTDTGAGTVATQMTKQIEGKVLTDEQAAVPATERPESVKGFIKPTDCKDIPAYEGWHWEFTARKVASDKIGHRDSVLYARLVEAPTEA